MTLSIADIGKKLGAEALSFLSVSLEQKLCLMIEKNEISASISHKDDSIVHFLDTLEEPSECASSRNLSHKLNDLEKVLSNLRQQNRNLQLSSNFLQSGAILL
jgi:hypothetical protein